MGQLESEAQSGVSSGLTQLLFGPVFLICEVIGILLPGFLFCLLLAFKGYRLPVAMFHVDYLGYRTKVCVFLLVAYMVGKVLNVPLRTLLNYVVEKVSVFGEREPREQAAKNFWYYLLAGVVIVPTFLGKSRILDYLMVGLSALSFEFGAGFGLLLLSAIPGDGKMRILELLAGLLLLLALLKSLKQVEGVVAVTIGYSLHDFLSKIPVEKWPATFEVAKALGKVSAMATPATSTPEDQKAVTT